MKTVKKVIAAITAAAMTLSLCMVAPVTTEAKLKGNVTVVETGEFLYPGDWTSSGFVTADKLEAYKDTGAYVIAEIGMNPDNASNYYLAAPFYTLGGDEWPKLGDSKNAAISGLPSQEEGGAYILQSDGFMAANNKSNKYFAFYLNKDGIKLCLDHKTDEFAMAFQVYGCFVKKVYLSDKKINAYKITKKGVVKDNVNGGKVRNTVAVIGKNTYCVNEKGKLVKNGEITYNYDGTATNYKYITDAKGIGKQSK